MGAGFNVRRQEATFMRTAVPIQVCIGICNLEEQVSASAEGIQANDVDYEEISHS